MRYRGLMRFFAGASATGIALASLVAMGLASTPAEAAAPPGTPWTFGENAFGQLGSGTTATRRTAGPVSGLNGVIDMHGGREHVVALKSDGTVWTWGSKVEGQQGRGTTANGLVPTKVTSLGTDNVAVETGHNHTVVLKSNGTVWAGGTEQRRPAGRRNHHPAAVAGPGGWSHRRRGHRCRAGHDLRHPVQRAAVGLGPQQRGPAR